MEYVFLLLFFVLLFGVFKPFKGFKRWQFGLAAFVSFMLVGITAPDPKAKEADDTVATAKVSATDAAAMEKKNAAEINELRKGLAKLPATDVEANLDRYKRLLSLAPANSEFAAKVAVYEGRLAARARYEDNPEEALTIEDFKWDTGGFGSVMEIQSLTVRNDAPFAIKDFRLHCVHQGNSGTDMDRNTRTIFEIVPANGKKTFRDINMGFISSQVATSRCEIRDAVRV